MNGSVASQKPFCAGGEPPVKPWRTRKMGPAKSRVEVTRKIAMPLTSAARKAVVLLPGAKRARGNLLPAPTPSGRLDSESTGKTLAIMRPDLGVNDARRPLAVERVKDLLRGDPSHVLARFPGDTRRMRAR